jgi:phosphatidylglycerol---prolipoprotein diacylglyceryl transferase
MRPELLTWRAIHIPSYLAMLYLGLVAGAYASYAAGSAAGLTGETFAAAIVVLLVPSVLGARLAFVASRWNAFRTEPRRILPWGTEGGAVAYGALLSVPVSVPLLVALGLPVASFWDAGALGFLTAIVCLRAGCFLNGCCCGRETSSRLGCELADAAGVVARRVPTQLLEAGWAAVLLLGAALACGRMPFAGALFLSTLAAYAAGRFFLEFTRESPRALGGRLTVAQACSAAFVLVSVTVLVLGLWVR